jgi:hypothetical protein
MLNILSKNNIIDSTDMLDFAGGYGTLSKILNKYFGLKLMVYEPFVQTDMTNYILKEYLKKYKVVINSAMFEHITKRQDIESINELVEEDGCFMLHTLIREQVPKDPDWFYIAAPVHCAVHTNKSMELLMRQWGYISSVYAPIAKCWVLFKKEPDNITKKIELINTELQTKYFFYKKGFLDYWK